MTPETIYALSSGPGQAGIAVIRLSGPDAEATLERITMRPLPSPRLASHRVLYEPKTGTALDQALVLWMPGPASFTGEDVAELHIHGGRAVVSAVLEALGGLEGLRMAEPGEFTRRAFQNDKLDLTAAEGLADLVKAETEAQRRQALRQLQGELGTIYEDWRGRLLRALAHLEASIDFIEEDLPADLEKAHRADITKIKSEISDHLADHRRGERLRDGLQVAIIGPPNAGKSSLLNMLAQREAAIVAETAGTTRDVIEVHLDLGGYPVLLADTAGLRDSADPIEAEGVRRASARAEDADLRLAVLDSTAWPEVDPTIMALIDSDTLVIINKIDLKTPRAPLETAGRSALGVSIKTGENIDVLIEHLKREVENRCHLSEAPALTRARHRTALQGCHDALERALKASAPELVAEDLRAAVQALGRITGRVDVEDILDVIFQDFCIGK